MSKKGCDIRRQWCIDGKCISQEGLTADNVENPVFFPPNLEISVALGIYQVLKDIGPAPQISRKEASCMDGVVHGDAYVSRTRRGNDSPGIVNQEDGLERKTGFCLCMRQRQTKIEVLTASSIQTRWESLSSFVLCDKSGIYLFRLIALVHFE